ncbi:hypothetical protein LINGRAHAP2_LOCUS2556 [Linum grandiflorum]
MVLTLEGKAYLVCILCSSALPTVPISGDWPSILHHPTSAGDGHQLEADIDDGICKTTRSTSLSTYGPILLLFAINMGTPPRSRLVDDSTVGSGVRGRRMRRSMMLLALAAGARCAGAVAGVGSDDGGDGDPDSF